MPGYDGIADLLSTVIEAKSERGDFRSEVLWKGEAHWLWSLWDGRGLSLLQLLRDGFGENKGLITIFGAGAHHVPADGTVAASLLAEHQGLQ